MASEDRVGRLEEEGLKRKERLKALKRKVEHRELQEDKQDPENDKYVTLPKPKFRSYKPTDEDLQKEVIEDAKPGNVEEEVKEQLEAAHSKVVIQDLDISNLAPRKPDWDLKRDVAKKLEKLERLTQRAIAELIRERLKKEAGGEIDLATSVTIGAESVQSTEQESDIKPAVRSEQSKRKPCARQIQAQETLSEDECKSVASSCTETSTSTGNILDRLIVDPSRNREPFLKQWPLIFPKTEETVPDNAHQYKASMKAEQLSQMCSLHVDSDPNKFRVPAIIATLGPSSTTVDSVLELLESGVNVIRVSMAHADPCSRISYFQNIIEATNRYSTQVDYTIPIGIMMDLKGPEIRTGKIDPGYLKDLSSVELPLKKGSIVRLTCDRQFENRCSDKFIFVDFEALPVHVEPGICIYLDGDVKLRVESVDGLQILCKIELGGMLRNYQQVHIPMVALPIPPITEYDRKCLDEAVEQGVDIVVVPKTRNEKIVYSIKAALEKKESDILVFAKISNYEGLCNIDRIISAADGIVIHKCDLALELPTAKIFIAQKEIVAKCNKAGKPVVCPAQLKSSMSDVAQFIIDGGDCVMLNVETAVEEEGPRSVLRLCEVIREAEAATMQIPYYNDLVNLLTPAVEPNCAIALAAVEVSNKIRAAAVLTITTSGRTAKLLSWFRPRCPVIAITRIGRTARQLNMWRTVIPLVYSGPPINDWHEDCAARIRYGISYGKYKDIIRPGDPLVLITGYRKNAGFTNCLRVVFASLDNGHVVNNAQNFFAKAN